MLRKISGPKMGDVAGEWRRLYKKERHNLYPSSNIIRMIKSRRMRLAEHVARTGERRGAYRGLWANLMERDRLGDTGVDGRIILQWIFK